MTNLPKLPVGMLVSPCCPQVRDLRRLLELYQRWHPRLFNYCDYNQFESSLEKMSGTNALKVCQRLAALHRLPHFGIQTVCMHVIVQCLSQHAKLTVCLCYSVVRS